MRELDLISLMVEETMTMEHQAVLSLKVDQKRSCYILDYGQTIEIPFGFGPFTTNKQKIFLDANDEYLYPLLARCFNKNNVVIELALDNLECIIHEPSLFQTAA